MATYPQVWFVDGPSEDSAVRLDMNSDFGLATCRVEHDSFTLGAPPLLGESDSVSAALGLREAAWTLQIRGPKAAAYEVRTAVSRELLRPTGWVRVRLDETSPVHYMRTYRGSLDALSLEYVKNDSDADTWRLPVSLDAEPYLLGERITLPTVTVTQTPDGSYPMRMVLPSIEGDAPAALRVEIAPAASASASNGESVWLIGCISGSAAMADPVVEIGTGDGFTAGTGTGAGASSSTYFGSTYRAVTIAAATPNLLKRLSGTFPVLPVGQYKVQLRAQIPAVLGGRTALFRFGRVANPVTTAFPSKTVEVVTSPSGTQRQVWVDLGEFSFPLCVEPAPDAVVTALAGAFTLDLGWSDGGTGVINIDAFKLIPVGGPTVDAANFLRASGPTGEGIVGGITGVFDGETASYWGRTTTGGTVREAAPTIEGGFPTADPASEQNVLIVMATDNGLGNSGTGSIMAKGTQVDVTVSYHPQKLHI